MAAANSARNRKLASLIPVPANEASTTAETLDSAEALVSWMLKIVDEWQIKNAVVYALAAGGRQRNNCLDRGIFRAIEDQTESAFHFHELNAGIYRLAQLLSVPVKDSEVSHG
jgi:hypothetical protein